MVIVKYHRFCFGHYVCDSDDGCIYDDCGKDLRFDEGQEVGYEVYVVNHD